MNNPQYIEYLNTLGAEIDVSSQPRIEVDVFLKENIANDIANDKKFDILGRLSNQITYHIRYKYYQFYNMVKHFTLDPVHKYLREK